MPRMENTHVRRGQDVLLQTDLSNNTQLTYTESFCY